MWLKKELLLLETEDGQTKDRNVITLSNIETPIKGFKLPRNYHMYVLSDEPILKGDWIYDKVFGIIQAELDGAAKSWKKIIATTDTSLVIEIGQDTIFSSGGFEEKHPIYDSLPELSSDFIKYFIVEYYKNNVITEIFVEYGQNVATEIDGLSFMAYDNVLLLDNSYIIIQKEEKKYLVTKQQLQKLASNAVSADYDDGVLNVDKWITENL